MVQKAKDMASSVMHKVGLQQGQEPSSKSAPGKGESTQVLPGLEAEMKTRPLFAAEWYRAAGKLAGKVALITGGDSGIGRATAVMFAREGARIAINYLPEEQRDAEETKKWIEQKESSQCLLLPGDLRDPAVCASIVQRTVDHYKQLDIVVNNAGTQREHGSITELTADDILNTFKTNIISMILVSKEAVKHLPDQTGVIINSSSVVSFKGKKELIDYSSTKGAITTFTRSLSQQLAPRGIRVNQVCPGPIWTPLIPSSFSKETVEEFGKQTALGRAGQPEECATCYVFLASHDSSYMTGQSLHPNGGTIVNA